MKMAWVARSSLVPSAKKYWTGFINYQFVGDVTILSSNILGSSTRACHIAVTTSPFIGHVFFYGYLIFS